MTMVASQITSLTIVYSIVYFRRRSKKTSKLGVTGLCAGNSPGTGEFPTQMASYTVKFPFDDVIMITDVLVLGCWDPLQTDWCWAAGIHYRQTGAGLLGSITDRLVLGCWDPLQTDWCWAAGIHYRQTGAGLLGSITDRLVLGCWDPLQTDWCWAAGIHYRQTGAGIHYRQAGAGIDMERFSVMIDGRWLKMLFLEHSRGSAGPR